MKTLFVDTSAIYALLDADDAGHVAIKKEWGNILDSDILLVTSNYILVEVCALLQNRIGVEAVRRFKEDIEPLLKVCWIDESLHHAASSALLVAGKKRLSLVDCTSFEVMRQGGVQQAFTLDRHFREQGFAVVP